MEKWYQRLKSARQKKKLTLEKTCGLLHDEDHITVQSLLAYEKGRATPKIDTLGNLCAIYGVTTDYIIYGNENPTIPNFPVNNTMLCLFMLLYSKKIKYIKDGIIIIEDYDLMKKINILSIGAQKLDLATFYSMEKLLEAMNRIADLK